ncbi:MAG: hypothetical protein ACFBSD_02355 [Paracoccaceae bacterium]
MRIFTTAFAAIAATALMGALPAEAQNLAARQKQASNEDRLANSASDISRRCGMPLETGFDWSTFTAADYENRRQPYSFCEGAISAIRALCDDPAGKAAVAAKIRRLTCAKGDGLAGRILSDGTYYITFDWTSPNIYYWHLDNLRNKL